MNSKNQEGKTTFTFRISPENKLQIAATAKGLGMSPSQYMEALALKRQGETINQLVEEKAANQFRFSKPLQKKVNRVLANLKERYPEYSNEELMAACLDHAYENIGAVWKRSLRTFLQRLSNYLSNHQKR